MMDLAKIRMKARQALASLLPDEPPQPKAVLPVSAPVQEAAAPGAGEIAEDFFSDISANYVPQLAPVDRAESFVHKRQAARNPIDVIMAGRESAGCDEELPLTSVDQEQSAAEAYQEFLCFRVSDEIYGINIMDIKELIKPREVTEVPRAPSFVSGIISLRGTIIPVIDMLDRLGLKHGAATGRERVIVVRHGSSFSGLLVDEIIQVVRIAQDCLENTPAVLEGIDREFVSGIGRSDGRMIILLNLVNITDMNLY